MALCLLVVANNVMRCIQDPTCDWFDVADRMIANLSGTCGDQAVGDPERAWALGAECPPGSMCCWIKVWDGKVPVNVSTLDIGTAGEKLRN